jgi:hypothetical protein
MSRTSKHIFSTILSIALFGAVYGDGEAPSLVEEGVGCPAMGVESTSFPDTPQNHWAYEAVAKLREHGILQGYPDGLYRGGRTATRYEMAVAVHAAWSKLKAMYEGLEGQIKALTDKLNSLEGLSAEVKSLRDQLAALEKDVDTMKSWGEDITNLKKLAGEFKEELTRLGADVEAMKKDLASMEERVRKLEHRRHTIEISGDANVLVLAGHGSTSAPSCDPCTGPNESYNTYGMIENGRVTGVGRGAYAPDRWGNPVGPLRDLTVLHEAAFQFKTTNERGPKAQATFVVGNTLSSTGSLTGWPPQGRAIGNLNSSLVGRSFLEGCTEIYFYDAKLMGAWKYGNLVFNAELGRIPYNMMPYLFQNGNSNYYYNENPRWFSHNYHFDGALFKFVVPSAELHLLGGRVSRRFASGAGDDCDCPCVDINPISIARPLPFCCGPFWTNQNVVPTGLGHSIDVDQIAAARLKVLLGKWGDLNLGYLVLGSNDSMEVCAPYRLCEPRTLITRPCEHPCGFNCTRVNRMDAFGGEARLKPLSRVELYGGYYKSNFNCGPDVIWSDDNNVYFAEASYAGNGYGLMGGYKRIEKNYYAPGNWDRLGLDSYPRDIEGPYSNLYVDILRNLRLTLWGRWYRGISEAVRNNYYTDLIGQIDYKVTPRWTLSTKYKQIEIGNRWLRACLCDNLRQRWGTFKSRYAFTDNVVFVLGYAFGGTNWLTPFHFTGFRCLTPGTPCCNPFNCRPTLNDFWGRGNGCVSGNVFKGGLIYAHFIYKF